MERRVDVARAWPAGTQRGHRIKTEESGAAIAANLEERGYGD